MRQAIGAPGAPSRRPLTLAVEEPLEVRLDDEPVALVMRSPGDDFDLALGLLAGEGLIGAADDVVGMMHCLDETPDGSPTYNVVAVTSTRSRRPAPGVTSRAVLVGQGCGLQGTRLVEAVLAHRRPAPGPSPAVAAPLLRAEAIATLPQALTGRRGPVARAGLGAAAGLARLGGREPDPLDLHLVREDLSAQHAVDKAVGALLRAGARAPLADELLVVTGPLDAGVARRAATAGLRGVVGTGPATSLAAEIARAAGLLLAWVDAEATRPTLVCCSGQEHLRSPHEE